MKTSTIKIEVTLNDARVPQQISWNATESSAVEMQDAKSMMVSFWDGRDKSAMRIDLWTDQMMVDEMIDFYFQTFMGMADTLQKSTGQGDLVSDLRTFAQQFFKKFHEAQQNPTKNLL